MLIADFGSNGIEIVFHFGFFLFVRRLPNTRNDKKRGCLSDMAYAVEWDFDISHRLFFV